MATINIASVQFRNVFLRMDGTGVTHPTGSGGGTVNCQFSAGSWETFNLIGQSDGTFGIASVAFPGVYLRMDGTGVTRPTGSGGGTVNCQYSASTQLAPNAWEKFYIVPQGAGTVAIASQAFPGVFLRMDGTGVTHFLPSGGGKVNCQYSASVQLAPNAWERYKIIVH